ncbi:uncharacterized protein MEPE_02249 [Melanopsichium pennsylvanicum]|uniref:Uncharacterized protein n=1 Tax=Melanopsichium pennsylvanicum TaxID=63383 RepID=A0AAJ4XJJ9_9BASI|nr:uncharacterized protein MEPE_02249 [Melanopsichium pennsylvanicum]
MDTVKTFTYVQQCHTAEALALRKGHANHGVSTESRFCHSPPRILAKVCKLEPADDARNLSTNAPTCSCRLRPDRISTFDPLQRSGRAATVTECHMSTPLESFVSGENMFTPNTMWLFCNTTENQSHSYTSHSSDHHERLSNGQTSRDQLRLAFLHQGELL